MGTTGKATALLAATTWLFLSVGETSTSARIHTSTSSRNTAAFPGLGLPRRRVPLRRIQLRLIMAIQRQSAGDIRRPFRLSARK